MMQTLRGEVKINGLGPPGRSETEARLGSGGRSARGAMALVDVWRCDKLDLPPSLTGSSRQPLSSQSRLEATTTSSP